MYGINKGLKYLKLHFQKYNFYQVHILLLPWLKKVSYRNDTHQHEYRSARIQPYITSPPQQKKIGKGLRPREEHTGHKTPDLKPQMPQLQLHPLDTPPMAILIPSISEPL